MIACTGSISSAVNTFAFDEGGCLRLWLFATTESKPYLPSPSYKTTSTCTVRVCDATYTSERRVHARYPQCGFVRPWPRVDGEGVLASGTTIADVSRTRCRAVATQKSPFRGSLLRVGRIPPNHCAAFSALHSSASGSFLIENGAGINAGASPPPTGE